MKPEVQVCSNSGKESVLIFLGTASVYNPDIQTARLMALARSGELERTDPDHPLLYALLGIKNRHALTHSIKTTQRLIAIRKKGSQRTALVKENITGEGLRIAERFLNGGRP